MQTSGGKSDNVPTSEATVGAEKVLGDLSTEPIIQDERRETLDLDVLYPAAFLEGVRDDDKQEVVGGGLVWQTYRFRWLL